MSPVGGGAGASSRSSEAGHVRPPEAGLLRTVHHLYVRVRLGQLVGQVPGAVWAVVVNDQQVSVRDGLADPPAHDLQVLPLVVSGHHNENAARGRVTFTHRLCSPSSSAYVRLR